MWRSGTRNNVKNESKSRKAASECREKEKQQEAEKQKRRGLPPGICSKPDIEMVGRVFSMLDMQKDKNIPIQSRKNCVTVLGCDPVLSGKIKFNTLSNRKNVEGALPWNKSEKLREWTNIDNEYLIYYMETYTFKFGQEILAALEMAADVNKFKSVYRYA